MPQVAVGNGKSGELKFSLDESAEDVAVQFVADYGLDAGATQLWLFLQTLFFSEFIQCVCLNTVHGWPAHVAAITKFVAGHQEAASQYKQQDVRQARYV